MPSLRSVIVDNRYATLTGGLSVAAILIQIGTPARHSLTTSAASWLCICAFARIRGGFQKTGDSQGQALAWAAGGLLALSSICERAVDDGHIWWAKALLPAIVHGMLKADIFGSHTAGETRSAGKIKGGNGRILAVVTVTGFVALKRESGLAAEIALGCCNALLIAVFLALIKAARREGQLGEDSSSSGDVSVNRLLSQPTRKQSFENETLMTVLGHMSLAAALVTSLAAVMLESFSPQQFWFAFLVQQILIVVLGIGMVLVHVGFHTGVVMAVGDDDSGHEPGREFFGGNGYRIKDKG